MDKPVIGASRRRPLAAALLVAAASLALAGPARADSLRVVTLDEQNCREIAVTRMPVRTEQLRAIVPERYGLLAGTVAGSSRTLLNTYTCESMSVDDAPVVAGGGGPSVVSIWSAVIGSRDGVAASGSYLLTYATDNPVLFAELHQSGLPVAFEPVSTGTASTCNGVTTLTFALRGPVEYDLTSVASEPTAAATASIATWYRDTPEGSVALHFHNTAPAPTTSAVTADFSRFEPYASMALTALTPANLPSFYFHGSWVADADPSP